MCMAPALPNPSRHRCVSSSRPFGAQLQCDLTPFWPDMCPPITATPPPGPPFLLPEKPQQPPAPLAPLCINDLAAQFRSSYGSALISHGKVPHIDAFPHHDGDVSKTVSIAHEARLERYGCTYRLSRKHASETQ